MLVKVATGQQKETDVRRQLRSTIMSLNVMAMILNREHIQSTASFTSFIKRYSLCIYSTTVLLTVITFTVQHMVVNLRNDIYAIQDMIWNIQSLGHYALFYLLSVKQSHSKLFDSWQAYREKYKLTPTLFQSNCVVNTVILWIITACSLVFNWKTSYWHCWVWQELCIKTLLGWLPLLTWFWLATFWQRNSVWSMTIWGVHTRMTAKSSRK